MCGITNEDDFALSEILVNLMYIIQCCNLTELYPYIIVFFLRKKRCDTLAILYKTHIVENKAFA